MAISSNIFNNRVEITAAALDTVKNNLKMASRVARRWDSDYLGSTKIGDTLNIRVPGFYPYRTGATASPTGYNDSYVPVTLAQGGADILLTSKELTLNVDEFKQNVVKPLMATVYQQIDAAIIAKSIGFNQFAGKVGTAVTNLTPFLNGFASMQTQSACPVDEKISGLLNPYMQASMVGGMATYLNPTKEISDQYRNGSMGSAGGLDYFSTANAPTQTCGTWSGVLTVTTTLPADGATAFTIAGMSGTFNPGENFTIAGVHAVNPQGKGVQGELKQFTVTSQVGATVNFTPAMILTGPLQNIDALPISTAAVYPWGVDAASALAAGTGQVVRTSLAFHEDALALGMADIMDVEGFGGASSTRMKDDQTGLRCRSLFWYNGVDDTALFRLDVLFGAALLRQGFGAKIIS
ncbi:MAG: hypothetical protein JHC33_07965 [Ignisphaera sp.]|nr:hypothetical protein [Ignisphaera sp.]